MTKRCIVHIPFYVDTEHPSGSQIRPMKMIDAFRNIGYEVDVVIGYGSTRKLQIKSIKSKIKKGIKYDFVYSESSTEPTLLTEKSHYPTHPLLDFSFLKFCNKNNIKVGLFYRDVYWKFEEYKKEISLFKRSVSGFFYKFDLKEYEKFVSVFYLPSTKMYKYIGVNYSMKIDELPPGADIAQIEGKEFHKDSITIFYVGGINSELYNLELLFETVRELEFVKLTVCCRIDDWEKNKERYNKYMCDRIKIIHKSGMEIDEYIGQSDIFSLFLKPTLYREFAMPVKLFTYLSYKKPIIGVKNSAAGDFVEKNDIGWNLDYSKEELTKTLKELKNKPDIFNVKRANIEAILTKNTWEARADKVTSDLMHKYK